MHEKGSAKKELIRVCSLRSRTLRNPLMTYVRYYHFISITESTEYVNGVMEAEVGDQ